MPSCAQFGKLVEEKQPAVVCVEHCPSLRDSDLHVNKQLESVGLLQALDKEPLTTSQLLERRLANLDAYNAVGAGLHCWALSTRHGAMRASAAPCMRAWQPPMVYQTWYHCMSRHVHCQGMLVQHVRSCHPAWRAAAGPWAACSS